MTDRWEKETCFSSKIEIEHPCFKEMVNMKGHDSISWVLCKMCREKSWILVLLGIWIDKKKHPTTDDMIGNLNKLTDTWLQWGVKNKIIKRNYGKNNTTF